MKTLQVTKYTELNEFATLLKNNGFNIISSYKKEDPENTFNSYFYFYKDGYFGYCQKERFEGFGLSTVNKPCKNFGTGHSYKKQWNILTIEEAQNCLDFCKRIINTKEVIKNYNSLDEFMNKQWGVKELF